MGETELWSLFIDPIMSAMVADPARSVCLRWTNKKVRENTTFTRKRPDAVISKVVQLDYEESLGFGEVKLAEPNPDKNAICLDLLRLGVFSKSTIDENAMDGVLAFQVHGKTPSLFRHENGVSFPFPRDEGDLLRYEAFV